MHKKVFLLSIGFLAAITLQAQKLTVVVNYVTNDGTTSKNNIFYQPGQLLTWDDFKAKPEAGSDAAALTTAGFGLNMMFSSVGNETQIVISVNCNFSKKDSWVLPGNKTAYILNHEQKHFDIAFIHTAMFIQNLRKANLTVANYAQQVDKIYSDTEKALNKMQDQYDAATSHSRITDKQAEWNEKISGQLAAAIKVCGQQQAAFNH